MPPRQRTLLAVGGEGGAPAPCAALVRQPVPAGKARGAKRTREETDESFSVVVAAAATILSVENTPTVAATGEGIQHGDEMAATGRLSVTTAPATASSAKKARSAPPTGRKRTATASVAPVDGASNDAPAGSDTATTAVDLFGRAGPPPRVATAASGVSATAGGSASSNGYATEAVAYAVLQRCNVLFGGGVSTPRVECRERALRRTMRRRFEHVIRRVLYPQTSSSSAGAAVAVDDESSRFAFVIENYLFSWWYYTRPAVYRQRCREIIDNLQSNGWHLLTRYEPEVICTLPAPRLAEGTAEDQWRQDHRRRLLRDLKPATPDPNVRGTFQCKNPDCRSWSTDYYQLQTRSADEPMTIFVTCRLCHKRYKCS